MLCYSQRVAMSSEPVPPNRARLFGALLSCIDFACIIVMGACSTKGTELPRAVHVNLHLLHFDSAPSLTTSTSESEARHLITEAHQIWSGAGISIVVDSVQNEEALPSADAISWLTASQGDDGPDAVMAHLALIRRAMAVEPGTFHVYFIGDLPCNGIVVPPNGVFVQDHPHLREVAGGAREPRARVLAHELGHSFGLAGHADEPDRLMFGGSTGVRLTDSEIATAVHFVTSVHSQTPQ